LLVYDLFDYKKSCRLKLWSPAECSPRQTCKTRGIDTSGNSRWPCSGPRWA